MQLPTDELVNEVNVRVAKTLGASPRDVKVTFVPLVAQMRFFRDGHMVERVTKGRCFPHEGLITVLVDKDWATTLIHELVHLYKPELGEKAIKMLVWQCVRYLKLQAEREEAIDG